MRGSPAPYELQINEKITDDDGLINPDEPTDDTGNPDDVFDPSGATNGEDDDGLDNLDEPSAPNDGDFDDDLNAPKPDKPSKPTLPVTGQLWWPVPMLAMGGILLFTLGWVRKRRSDEE